MPALNSVNKTRLSDSLPGVIGTDSKGYVSYSAAKDVALQRSGGVFINLIANNMAIVQASGEVEFTHAIPKTASTAFAGNSVVTTTSGQLTTAANSELGLLGIIPRVVTSASSDYASTTGVPLIKLHDRGEYEIDVQGTATAAMVGEAYDLYSTTGISLDVGNSTYKQFVITKFISASKVWVKPNMAVLTP